MMRKTIILITLLFFMFSNAPIQAQPAERLSDTSKIMKSFRRLSIDKQIEYIRGLDDVEGKIKEELATLLARYKEDITQEEKSRAFDLLANLSPEDCLGYFKVVYGCMDEITKHPEMRKEVIQRIEADSQLSQEQKDLFIEYFIEYVESGKTLRDFLSFEIEIPEDVEIPEEFLIDFNTHDDILAMLTFVTQVARLDKINITNKDIEDYLSNIKPSARIYQGLAELYFSRIIKDSKDDWHKKAVHYYKKGLELNPDNSSVYLGLLTVYFSKPEDYKDQIPKTLKEAEKIDSENAIYEYLLAYYYFTTDKEELALSQIEAGSKKPYINTYQVDSFKATVEVLKQLGVGSITAKVLIRELFGIVKAYDLWSLGRKIRVIASEKEKEGRWEEAKDMYKYLIEISEQLSGSLDTPTAKLWNVWSQKDGYSGLARYYEETNQTKKARDMKEKAQQAEFEEDLVIKGIDSKLGGPLLGMELIYVELGREDFEKFIDERYLKGRDGEYLIEAGKVDTLEELTQMIRDRFL